MLLCKGDRWETERAADGGGTSVLQLGHLRMIAYLQFGSQIIHAILHFSIPSSLGGFWSVNFRLGLRLMLEYIANLIPT